MPKTCSGCAALAERVAALERRADAPPAAAPRAAAGPKPTAEDQAARLRALCPAAWAAGEKARREGLPATACPYQETRGGFRNAWLQGHARAGIAGPRLSQAPPAPVPAARPVEAPRPARVTNAYVKGEAAGVANQPVSDCPWGLEESFNRDQWTAGWRDGRKKASGARAKSA